MKDTPHTQVPVDIPSEHNLADAAPKADRAAINWRNAPEEHDFPAAKSYLQLLMTPSDADAVVAALRSAPAMQFPSKDILRASGLPALDHDNHHVAKDLHKIHHGVALSPVLLLRGDAYTGRALIIADGYHRICAMHLLDEDAQVHCRIVDRPDTSS